MTIASPGLDRHRTAVLACRVVRPSRRTLLGLVLALAVTALAAPPASAVPPIRHVFLVILENQSYDETFGPDS